jgi:hypothetical protein
LEGKLAKVGQDMVAGLFQADNGKELPLHISKVYIAEGDT